MPTPPLKYPIRTVSKMTGLGIDTLRAWERRYEAVRPTRDQRGRMYSDADVQRLRLLRDAVANGHAIGRIARLDLGALTAASQPHVHHVAPIPTRRGVIDAAGLVEAVERFDAPFLETELGRAASFLGPLPLWQDVLVPALQDVGVRWSDGRASVAHEHLFSAIVRNVLGTLVRSHSRYDTPARIVFATPSGELHELGTLAAAALAASGGLGAVYLGPNLPATDLVRIVKGVDTDVVVLGVTAAGRDGAQIEREVRAIASGLSRDVELWIGGAAAPRLARLLQPRVVAIHDYAQLTAQLERIGARF